MIDTIPLLCRPKVDVLAFSRGCGVPNAVTADLRCRFETDRASISRYEITRLTFTRINEGGATALSGVGAR